MPLPDHIRSSSLPSALQSPSAHALAGVFASGLAYVATCAASQCVQFHVLHVHTGLRVAPQLLGVATVAAASIAAVKVGDAVAGETQRGPSPTAAIVGATCFLALGGRFWRLSPSGLANVGALADTARGSLPATLKYATKYERETIQELGRRFGCHSCGARPLLRRSGPNALSYIADHQPPLSVVRTANEAAWRRLLGWRVTQRFYPQCTACSGKQAKLLSERANLAKQLGSARKALAARTTASAAVVHWPSPLRPWYAVGVALELLRCAVPESLREADAGLARWWKGVARASAVAFRDGIHQARVGLAERSAQ